MEVNGTILKIFNEYYTDNVAYVKIGNELSKPIKITKGIRQDCSLSPILFNIYPKKKTLDHWKKSCPRKEVPMQENKCLFSLNYADYQLIIAQDVDYLQFILKKTGHKKNGVVN